MNHPICLLRIKHLPESQHRVTACLQTFYRVRLCSESIRYLRVVARQIILTVSVGIQVIRGHCSYSKA